MKFTCQKEDLLKVFMASEPITGTKTNFSILSNLLFETRDDSTVSIKASNLETTIEARLPAKIASPGAITIFQGKLSQIIKQFPNGEVLFDLGKNSMMTVRSMDKKRNARATIIGTPKADFPELPSFPAKTSALTVDKLYFRRMIQKTLFAVSSDANKYTLNGVLFEVADSLMKMVAIDGRRLALIQSPLASKEDEYSLIIPQQVLSQLQKIIGTEGPLEIASAENRIHFRLDNFSISSNVLSGKFPNYNMFIPSSHQNQFAINTAEITGAISLASVLADAESNKMVWDLSGNSLKISAQNADYGESQEEIFVSYKGEEVRIGINYKLLGEILKEIETDETEFHFNNALSPILVREKNRKEYFYIIMPMRLEDKA